MLCRLVFRFVCLLWFVLSASTIVAQNPDEAIRAGAVVADSGLWAAQLNPASAISDQPWNLALGYRNYFFVPELHAANLLFSRKIKHNALFASVGVANGYPAWTVQQCKLGYALQLFSTVRAGLRFGWNKTYLTGIAPRHELVASAGLLFIPHRPFSLGVVYEQTASSTFAPMARIINVGAQSSYFDRLKISLVYIVEIQNTNRASIAFSYLVHKKISATLSFSSGSKPISYGMSFVFGKWSSILAFEHHLQLGVQPSIGIMHSF